MAVAGFGDLLAVDRRCPAWRTAEPSDGEWAAWQNLMSPNDDVTAMNAGGLFAKASLAQRFFSPLFNHCIFTVSAIKNRVSTCASPSPEVETLRQVLPPVPPPTSILGSVVIFSAREVVTLLPTSTSSRVDFFSSNRMEDLFSIHPGIFRCGDAPAGSCQGTSEASEVTGCSGGSDLTDLIKAQIANHPRYPSLLSAYIECRKVGAPPEVATLLEEIGREKYSNAVGGEIGTDPELDEFMESYCHVLERYKEELLKPFDEAASFLCDIEMQLTNLCKASTTTATATGSSLSDEVIGSSEEDLCGGDAETSESHESGNRLPDHELKDMLLKKYSGYLTNLRKEFLKKRKKGKLPKDARLALLDWWNTHYRWPYPTEEEKAKLAERTGLDQKQINNWFINQRKRHWKPSEDMRFALMEGVSGTGGTMLYFDRGTIGP